MGEERQEGELLRLLEERQVVSDNLKMTAAEMAEVIGCLSSPNLSEHDQLVREDKRTLDEIKFELLESMELSAGSDQLEVVVSAGFGLKIFRYVLIFGNGSQIDGPFDFSGEKAESDRRIAHVWNALDDIRCRLIDRLDGVPLRPYEVEPIVFVFRDEMLTKLREHVERGKILRMFDKLEKYAPWKTRS